MSLIGKFFGGKGGKESDEGRQDTSAKPAGGSSSSSTRRAPSSVRLPRPSASASSVKLPAIRPPEETAKTEESKRKIRASTKGKEIGAILVKDAKISEEHLEKALEIQRKKGGLLGQILVALGVCSKADVGAALRKQRTITTVVLDKVKFDPEALQTLPRPFCEKNRLIPFEKIGNQLCVAMANVLDTQAKNEMKQMTQLQIKSFDASWVEIKAAIERELPSADGAPPSPPPPVKKETAEDIVIELPEDELLPVEPEAAVQPLTAKSGPSPAAAHSKDTAVIAKMPPAPAVKAAPPPGKSAAAPAVSRSAGAPAASPPAVPSPIAKAAPPPAKPAAPAPAVITTAKTSVPPMTPPKTAIKPPPPASTPQLAAKPAAVETKPPAPPLPPAKIAAIAAETATAAIDVIEDLEAYGIEEIAPPAAAAQPPEIAEIEEEVVFPHAVLSAIPMTATYFAEVVQWGKADPERRWLAEHLADNVLPVEPAPDKLGA